MISEENDYTEEVFRAKSYNDKFVVFIDILGFREIIVQTDKNNVSRQKHHKEDNVGKIYELMNSLAKNLDQTTIQVMKEEFIESYSIDRLGEIHIRKFSDSIFLVTDPDRNSFAFLIYFVHYIVYEMLRKGFYARGGISFGELVCDDTALFGPAIIKAYDIERKMAGEARVILSNEATEQYKNFTIKYPHDESNGKTQFFLQKYLKQSPDGPYQLQEFAHFQDNAWVELLQKHQGNQIKETFNRTLTMYTENPKVFNKIRKVAERFNDAIKKIDVSFMVDLPSK
jgi:hypothetical protein